MRRKRVELRKRPHAKRLQKSGGMQGKASLEHTDLLRDGSVKLVDEHVHLVDKVEQVGVRKKEGELSAHGSDFLFPRPVPWELIVFVVHTFVLGGEMLLVFQEEAADEMSEGDFLVGFKLVHDGRLFLGK